MNTANGITYNLVVLPDHLFQNQSFLYVLGEVCSDVVVSLLSGSNINLQSISECLPSIFLYSLIFLFMTERVTYSPVRSYFVTNIQFLGISLRVTSSAIWKVRNLGKIELLRHTLRPQLPKAAQLNQFAGKPAVNAWDRL